MSNVFFGDAFSKACFLQEARGRMGVAPLQWKCQRKCQAKFPKLHPLSIETKVSFIQPQIELQAARCFDDKLFDLNSGIILAILFSILCLKDLIPSCLLYTIYFLRSMFLICLILLMIQKCKDHHQKHGIENNQKTRGEKFN